MGSGAGGLFDWDELSTVDPERALRWLVMLACCVLEVLL